MNLTVAQPLTRNSINGTKRGYDLKTLADQYSVSVAFIRKEIRESRLKATRLGSRVIILQENWENYLNRGENNEEK